MHAYVLAADAGQSSTPVLLFLALLALAVYAGFTALFPWKKCIVCDDKKKFYSPFSSRVFRLCPRCHGKGKEFRAGTRLWRGMLGHGFDRHN